MKETQEPIYLKILGDIEDSDATENIEDIRSEDVEHHKAELSWVSVEDRYPPFDKDNHKQYLVRVSTGSIKPEIHYAVTCLVNRNRFGIEMDWTRVTHWMTIPSFDEILEANKDVLKRLKEKGD